MKKFFIIALLLATPAHAQTALGLGEVGVSLNANAGAPPQIGTAFALPQAANTVTYVVSFASAPSAVEVELQVSNDNSIWSEADSSDYGGGESRTIYTAAKFVRVVEISRTGGGAITATVTAKNSPTATIATSDRIVSTGGILTINESAGTTFARLNLGGTTGVWPSLRPAITGGRPILDLVSADNAQFAIMVAHEFNPQSGLNISPTLGTGYIGFDTRTFLYSPANGKYKMSNYLDTFGVVYEFAGVPTIGACGTSPSVAADANNTTGTIVVGTANPTSCVLNFNTAASGAWIKAPRCVANVITATAADVRALGVTATTTVLTLTPATAFASTTSIGYHCESSK